MRKVDGQAFGTDRREVDRGGNAVKIERLQQSVQIDALVETFQRLLELDVFIAVVVYVAADRV